MEILGLLLAVAGVIGILAGYGCLVGMLNRRSEEIYGYTPVTFGKSALMLLPFALTAFGLFAWQEPTQVNHAEICAPVAFACACLVTSALYWLISLRSSPGIALVAMISLTVNAVLIIGAISVYAFAQMLRAEARRNRRY
jgi:hypothetical protein